MLNNLTWEAADAAYLRNIFSQPSGQKFLQVVKAAIPRVTATKLEEVSIEALKKQGAEDLYDAMTSLANVQPELEAGKDYVDLTREGD